MSPDEGGGSVVRHFEFYSRPAAGQGLRGERDQGGGDDAARVPERRLG